MKIYIASDHGGFEFKNKLVVDLKEKHVIIDLGPENYNESDDYPDFAELVAKQVSIANDSKGILLCRSGNGMCITANKFKGVRASLCINEKHAEMSVKDDDINLLCIASDFVSYDECLSIVNRFLNTKFSKNERHIRRLKKIEMIEKENFHEK